MIARARPFTVLDVTKWYGETSGGVRTYLNAKRDYVRERPDLRHVLVIPGERDSVTDDRNTRCYRLRGPTIPTQRQYRFLLAPRSLRLIIERERPDIIEVGSPFAVPWLTRFASRRVNVPMVTFYHTNLSTAASALSPSLRLLGSRVASSYLRRLDSLFEATLVACDGAAEDLRAAGARRIERVSLGVDLDVFTPERRAHATWTRTRLGLPVRGQLVGYLGRLAQEKNLGTLMSAWERIERSSDASLVIVGAGPLEAELRRRALGHRVHFLPFQRNRDVVADLLASLDVAAAPGASETFGLAALEAMSCGTPVATSDQGGVAELVRRSGGGATFSSFSPQSAADAVLGLLHEPSGTRGRLAREYAEREHAWPVIFSRIFDLYRRVAA